MADEKRTKLKKGMLAVRVGLEGGEEERFVIPIRYLHHALFTSLLDTSREVYGYRSSGPLRLPCSVDDFLRIRWLIERESSPHQPPHQRSRGGGSRHQVHHHHHLPSFSLHSC